MFYLKQTYYHLFLPTFLLGSNVASQLPPHPLILLLGSNLIMKFPGHPQTARARIFKRLWSPAIDSKE